MSDLEALLARCRKRDAVFTPESNGDLQVQALTPRPDELGEELKHDQHETLALLSHQREQEEGTQIPLTDEARAFLEQHVSPAVLEVFSEWQGLLIGSSALGGTVWVVRDHQNGRRLAQETGRPFILLDEVLGQKGQTSEEARETLLPWRKVVGRKQAESRMRKINGIGHTATAELTPRQEKAIAALLADEAFLVVYQEAQGERRPEAGKVGTLPPKLQTPGQATRESVGRPQQGGEIP